METDPKDRERIIDIIDSHYDVGTVVGVREILGGTTNRSFGVTVEKDGRSHVFFVREYKQGIAPDDIRFEHALIEHTIRRGLTVSAGVVATPGGETFVSHPPSGGMFAVYEYLPGQDRYAWHRPCETDKELESAGRLLADLHHAVSDFDPGPLKREEPPISSLWGAFPEWFKGYAEKKHGDAVLDRFRLHLPQILKTIAVNPLTPTHTAGLPLICAHCDYHPGNLKWEGERIVGIFDFDWCKIDLRLFDLCMSVIYFCGQWKGSRDGELSMGHFLVYLGSYHRRLIDLNGLEPLTEKEIALVPRMLTIANLYLLNWTVADYLGKASARRGEYLTYLKHNLRLMHWLEANRDKVAGTVEDALV